MLAECIKGRVERLRDQALFAKWCGPGNLKEEIMKWWLHSFKDQVSINPLPNAFYLIECIDWNLKQQIVFGKPLFFNGHNFHCKNWESNFDPWNYKIKQTPTWLKLIDLPS